MAANQITDQDIKKLARLAKIKISQDEIHSFATSIGDIVRWADIISSLDLAGVEPMSSAVNVNEYHAREDVIRHESKQDELMKVAPQAREGFFAVPKVID